MRTNFADEERAGRVGVCVLCLDLAVPWVGLQSVVVLFSGHTHLVLHTHTHTHTHTHFVKHTL